MRYAAFLVRADYSTPAKRLAGFNEAITVRTTSARRIVELHQVILPPADQANLERAGRFFIECVQVTAWALVLPSGTMLPHTAVGRRRLAYLPVEMIHLAPFLTPLFPGSNLVPRLNIL